MQIPITSRRISYNASHTHFARALAVFIYILETLNRVFNCNTDVLYFVFYYRFIGHLVLGA